MKISELRKKSKGELNKLLKQNREKLGMLRFDLISGRLKNHRKIRNIKKDIARILALLKNHAP